MMPGPPPEDRDLLKRIAAGDDAAFSAFYRTHLDAVIAFFRRRVPDAELAFDLAAETFAAVVASAGSYDGDGPAAAWLYGIARNKLRESLRRGRVENDARRRLGMEPVVLDDRDLERVEERALAGADAIRLLVDHRERLVRIRTAVNNDLLWHLHDLWPEQRFPAAALMSKKWSTKVARRLARAEQTARVRIARDELRHLRELSATIDALEAEIAQLVERVAPQLLAEPGFGPLTAGKLIGEIAGVARFSSDAKLARAGGIAPIPVSSGKTNRHRLDRGGNRQINTAIHRVAVTRVRCHPETKAYIQRKRAEGKTSTEAIRCLKRHLARRIWHLMQATPTPAVLT